MIHVIASRIVSRIACTKDRLYQVQQLEACPKDRTRWRAAAKMAYANFSTAGEKNV